MNNSKDVCVGGEQGNAIDEIKSALGIFAARHNGGVTELRVLMKDSSPLSGFYDDIDKMAQDAARIEAAGKAKGIYFTLNPVNPELLMRSANRLHQAKSGQSTANTDILRRNWLFIDFDAKRVTKTNSSNSELEAAKIRALEVNQWLTDEGFPEALIACSGNGYHLHYQIDLPNDDNSKQLIERFLKL